MIGADAASSKVSTWSRRWRRDGAGSRDAAGLSRCDAAAAATHRVYFPLRGFTSSLNLSVATALVLSRVFDWYPHFVGDLDENELRDLREEWRPRTTIAHAARARKGGWLDAPGTIPLGRRGRRRGGRLLRVVGAAEDPGGRARGGLGLVSLFVCVLDPDASRPTRPPALCAANEARFASKRTARPFYSRRVSLAGRPLRALQIPAPKAASLCAKPGALRAVLADQLERKGDCGGSRFQHKVAAHSLSTSLATAPESISF